ncbi:MAG: hypothetical protein JNL60_13045 [Bacteroidia bacterium]|nr:hypothetical protein [Bacteroidia bacterium]
MKRKKSGLGKHLLSVVILLNLNMKSQPVPVEIMTGSEYFFYQHSVSKSVSGPKLGFFNTSSLIAPYKPERKSELMSQSYFTYALKRSIKVGIGSFYASVPKFSPSAHIQFLKVGKNFLLLVVPRIDLKSNPSHDLMVLAEYKPKLFGTLKLHTRLQTMLNFTKTKHNRSYQNFRLGIDFKNFQAGFAINCDAYGNEFSYFTNYGIYIKKDLF